MVLDKLGKREVADEEHEKRVLGLLAKGALALAPTIIDAIRG